MYIPGTEVKQIKVVSLLGVIDAIAKGDKILNKCLFEEVQEADYGGQAFSNDTIFIYAISNLASERNEFQEMLYRYCESLGLTDTDDDISLIYFAVCW